MSFHRRVMIILFLVSIIDSEWLPIEDRTHRTPCINAFFHTVKRSMTRFYDPDGEIKYAFINQLMFASEVLLAKFPSLSFIAELHHFWRLTKLSYCEHPNEGNQYRRLCTTGGELAVLSAVMADD